MIDKKRVEKLKKEKDKIKKAAKNQVLGYITAALGLVAGLAWNEAIIALINEIFPFGGNTVLAKFVYAVIISLFVVIVSLYLVRMFQKEKEE